MTELAQRALVRPLIQRKVLGKHMLHDAMPLNSVKTHNTTPHDLVFHLWSSGTFMNLPEAFER